MTRRLVSPTGTRRPAVTLLEVVLAMTLLVLLSSMTYWFYGSSLASRNREGEADRRLQLMRTVLNRLTTEIRQASPLVENGRLGIIGEGERIVLTSVRLPSRGRNEWFAPTAMEPLPQFDITEVEYRIARHPEILDDDGYELALGLARLERKLPQACTLTSSGNRKGTSGRDNGNSNDNGSADGEGAQDAGDLEDLNLTESFFGEGDITEEDLSKEAVDLETKVDFEELYAPEIHYLRLCYFDGYKWWDSWDVRGGDNPLPQLVMVTVGFDSQPPLGEGLGVTANEEFCECMNRDPVDCERLEADRMSAVVRVPQADPFFRSRVGRETQSLIETLNAGTEQEGDGSEQQK